ncbi:MAG TPA: DUF2231 domain-containing protein [Actinomycetota bacterium]|jgi:uncharacterized membrane protein|nr:DUF2231 domain-containing protein [Actinomycetota bacterium]
MPINLRNVDAGGRPWTFKEWVQGKPLGHPSHPLFVHFPIAFYTATLVFDIMTRIEPNPGLVQAGTFLLVGAAAATVILLITGLTDWWGMVRGSSKRRIATRHLLLQVTAFVFFFTTLVLRFPDRTVPEAETLWIVLEAIGYVVLSAGQYFGGVLVYEKAMRVRTGSPGAREPDERSAV